MHFWVNQMVPVRVSVWQSCVQIAYSRIESSRWSSQVESHVKSVTMNLHARALCVWCMCDVTGH